MPLPDSFVKEWNATIGRVITEHGADVIQFNADISHLTSDELMELVGEREKKSENLALILTTFGGDPHAAYRMTRFLQAAYQKIIICVFGVCKSAGTLVLFGADQIVVSNWGELGPLDVQVTKEDDLIFRSSGLDVEEAINKLGIECDTLFQHFFGKTLEMGRGAITTKTASEIASSMAVGLLSPITQQIDPLKVGETNRQLRIVQDYAERLCRKLTEKQKDAIVRLSSAYPSHHFVIDRAEAETLFGEKVREPNKSEAKLERLLHITVKEPHQPKNSIIQYVDLIKQKDLPNQGQHSLFSSPDAEGSHQTTDENEHLDPKEDGATAETALSGNGAAGKADKKSEPS